MDGRYMLAEQKSSGQKNVFIIIDYQYPALFLRHRLFQVRAVPTSSKVGVR